jgi:hypothetical protein
VRDRLIFGWLEFGRLGQFQIERHPASGMPTGGGGWYRELGYRFRFVDLSLLILAGIEFITQLCHHAKLVLSEFGRILSTTLSWLG